MYSQRDEERVILEHCPETGRFLDIGAYSIMELSNTRALIDRGWTGVLVEPCPDACNNLIRQSQGMMGIEIVNALVAPEDGGLVEFYASPNALSTTDEQHMLKWAPHPGVSFRKIWSPSISVRNLLRATPGPYQFISIDCEGASCVILKALDLNNLGCVLVCVEADNNWAEIEDYLRRMENFKVIHRTAENLIAKRA